MDELEYQMRIIEILSAMNAGWTGKAQQMVAKLSDDLQTQASAEFSPAVRRAMEFFHKKCAEYDGDQQ